MKELTVISGKGGTGKTSITAAFASLTNDAVIADCDVDAADLHLILKPVVKKTIGFHGLSLASIDTNRCTKCGRCKKYCKFDAIDTGFRVIRDKCEGCGVCELVCPEDAVTFTDRYSGLVYISNTRFGPMAHAVLKTAEEASGKLITLVRENAKSLSLEKQKNLIIIDGPPGIGCPVISSITGVDLVLIVTEPTVSAIHDLKRILAVANHFKIEAMVCINKYSINPEKTEEIINFCKQENISVVGRVPYDNIVTEAMIQEKNVIEIEDNPVSDAIKKMWKNISRKLY